MSTLAYASLTTKREESLPGTSTAGSPPGVRSYVDALAALVPAEVLSLHALILAVTTETSGTDKPTTSITDITTLRGAFVGLLVLSIVLYVVPRLRNWDRLDYMRAVIPPLAFVAWTMLQRSTAFDAVSSMRDTQRTVVGLFLAVVLGMVATWLAMRADAKPVTPAITPLRTVTKEPVMSGN